MILTQQDIDNYVGLRVPPNANIVVAEQQPQIGGLTEWLQQYWWLVAIGAGALLLIMLSGKKRDKDIINIYQDK